MVGYFNQDSKFYDQCICDAWRVLSPYVTKPTKLVIQSGSGFGFVAHLSLTHDVTIPFHCIPHFGAPTVVGHKGLFHVFSDARGNHVLILEGRAHGYEGRSAWEIAFPIRVLARAKPGLFLFTNAAGGICGDYVPGDLVVIKRHINLMGVNPLLGLDEKVFGSRFVSLDHAYDQSIYDMFLGVIKRVQWPGRIHRGTYVGVRGPSYETEAEIDAFEVLKADLVGMSTIIEVITARSLGLRVSGLSLVSNRACGRSQQSVSHEEVIEAVAKARPIILELFNAIMTEL